MTKRQIILTFTAIPATFVIAVLCVWRANERNPEVSPPGIHLAMAGWPLFAILTQQGLAESFKAPLNLLGVDPDEPVKEAILSRNDDCLHCILKSGAYIRVSKKTCKLLAFCQSPEYLPEGTLGKSISEAEAISVIRVLLKSMGLHEEEKRLVVLGSPSPRSPLWEIGERAELRGIRVVVSAMSGRIVSYVNTSIVFITE